MEANQAFPEQLAYLARGSSPVIDAIYGPSEALFFDIDKLVTRIDIEPAQFFWLTKHTLQEELGRLSNEQFLEFGLLLGSPFLRSFPLFENPAFPGKLPTVRDALPMFNAAGRSALTLCAQFEDERRMQELDYTKAYKRAYLVVKHHVIIDIDGRVAPMHQEHTSSDMHEIIGLRLPEELYFYMSKGVIGRDVPNCLTSGEICLSLPLGTEDTEIYRQLVADTLTPIRAQSIGLLANCLHRFYQTKVITIRPWFDEDSNQRQISLKGLPSVKETVQAWRVSSDKMPEAVKSIQAPRGSFKFGLQSLTNSEFVARTFATKDTPVCLNQMNSSEFIANEEVSQLIEILQILSTQEDILSNVVWRFLQLRGYVDEKHNLTAWGKCLDQALSSVDPNDHLEDAIFIAIEMLRMDLLNTKNWFSHVSGGPMRGSGTFSHEIDREAH